MRRFFKIHRNDPLPFIKKIESLPNLRIMRMQGDVDMTTIPHIEKIKEKAVAQRGLMKKNLLLDLKDVGHVDSATIAALVAALAEFKNEDRQLALVNVPPQLRAMLDVMECRHCLVIYPNERQARRELEKNKPGKKPLTPPEIILK